MTKIILIELNLWYSMATHQLALTPISDFFLSSEVATMQQIDSIVYKLKPRLFYKFVHLQVYFVDFHPGVNCAWHDTGIRNDKYHALINKRILIDVIKFVTISNFCIIFLVN